MHSEMAVFDAGATSWWSWPNSIVWCLTGAATWRTGRNICVTFDSGLFPPLHENTTHPQNRKYMT